MSKTGLFQRPLAFIGRTVARRPGTVLAAVLALTLAAIPFAARTIHPDNVEKDLLKIMAAGFPRAEAYKRIAEEFGVTDRHFVLLELKTPDDLPEAKHFADLIAEELRADPGLVRSARSRLPLGRFLLDHAHLYVDGETSQLLAARMTDKAVSEAMQRNRELLRVSPEMKDRVLLDPLGLNEVLREVIGRRTGGASSPLDREGYLVSRDRRMLLVGAEPTCPAAQGERGGFTERLLRHTNEAVERARSKCFGDDPETGKRISAHTGGSYAGLREGGQLITGGILKSALTSFLGILLLFALVYRRPSAFIFIGLPLAVPVVWTLALVPVCLPEYGGRLSAIGGTFAAVLLGLGIDYAVHLYNRFVAERASGSTAEEAAERSITTTGEGILCGALTTVIAFTGMTLTAFRGFKEFGRLAALGVSLTALALLLGLPAALVLLSRLRGRSARAARPFSFGLGAVARLVRRRPRTLLAVGLLALAVSVAAMFPRPGNPQWGVWFELDLGKLGPPHHLEKVGEINRRAARAFNLDYREISVVVQGKTSEEVLARTARMRDRARSCALVRSVRGILDLVPSPSAQRRSMGLVKGLDLGGLPDRLDRAAAAAGFRPGAFSKGRFSQLVREMARRAEAGKVVDPEWLMNSNAPELAAVREIAGYVYRPPGADGTGYRTRTLLSVIQGHGEKGLKSHDYARLGREIGIDGREVTMTSYMLVIYEMKDSVRRDLFFVISLVGGTVLLALMVVLRRPVYVLAAISPVLLGGALMLLVMKVSGLHLNFINMLVFPVLIGIGVDNAVHLVIRYRQEGADAGAAVVESGRALVVCSLTTIFGFLSLLACPHWGLKSLGITVAIGMGFVLLASIFFVPGLLELISRRKK